MQTSGVSGSEVESDVPEIRPISTPVYDISNGWGFLAALFNELFLVNPPDSPLDKTIASTELVKLVPYSVSSSRHSFTRQTESTSSTRELMTTAPTPFAFTPSNCLRKLRFLQMSPYLIVSISNDGIAEVV